jgi:hypothetical protein
MKNIILIALICLIPSFGFSNVTLVQSNAGGSASGSISVNATITSSAGGFSSTTTAGSLLVLVVWANGGVSGGTTALTTAPISGGYGVGTWNGHSHGISAANGDGGFTYAGGCYLFYIPNAAAMSPAQTTTVTVKNTGSATSTVEVEFSLYEFAGVDAAPALDLAFAPQQGIANTGDSGTPSFDWNGIFGFTTSHTDLILMALSAQPGTALTAGSGYTLGISASVATLGQLEYRLNAPSGQTSATYTGSASFWALAAISFSAAPPGSTTVARHKGWIF